MKPKTVEVVNNILAIAWDDGHESYFELEALRRACPCAMCKGETNVMVEYKPPPQILTPSSFALRRLAIRRWLRHPALLGRRPCLGDLFVPVFARTGNGVVSGRTNPATSVAHFIAVYTRCTSSCSSMAVRNASISARCAAGASTAFLAT